jgi:hypothetical protein
MASPAPPVEDWAEAPRALAPVEDWAEAPGALPDETLHGIRAGDLVRIDSKRQGRFWVRVAATWVLADADPGDWRLRGVVSIVLSPDGSHAVGDAVSFCGRHIRATFREGPQPRP